MENRLKLLYSLQLIDSSLDELEELKGDLPKIVAELTESLENKLLQKKEFEEKIKKSIVSRDELDVEIISLKEKIEKYKAQQFQVKTNKQYDMLAREIDYSQERIAKLQKEMEDLENKVVTMKDDLEKLKKEIDTLQSQLTENKKELANISKENEEEELKLKHEREKIVVRMTKSDYQMYERIRKARDGKAIVPVKRNSCGGCYNRITPQRMLELRKNSAIITCERCGRILVSDEIVDGVKKMS
ncbi:MAG: C4-type zinc ribbon domain-containing protein [Leptospiraceae bacterium]|nr:C4-type zinc ribbon domain-containing protein [Leptospiraceae bacterium]